MSALTTGHAVGNVLIRSLAEQAEALVLDPKPGDRVEGVINAMGEALTAYESLVKATHTSSSAYYAFDDLAINEKNDYNRAKHAVQVLQRLHGPQEGRS